MSRSETDLRHPDVPQGIVVLHDVSLRCRGAVPGHHRVPRSQQERTAAAPRRAGQSRPARRRQRRTAGIGERRPPLHPGGGGRRRPPQDRPGGAARQNPTGVAIPRSADPPPLRRRAWTRTPTSSPRSSRSSRRCPSFPAGSTSRSARRNGVAGHSRPSTVSGRSSLPSREGTRTPKWRRCGASSPRPGTRSTGGPTSAPAGGRGLVADDRAWPGGVQPRRSPPRRLTRPHGADPGRRGSVTSVLEEQSRGHLRLRPASAGSGGSRGTCTRRTSTPIPAPSYGTPSVAIPRVSPPTSGADAAVDGVEASARARARLLLGGKVVDDDVLGHPRETSPGCRSPRRTAPGTPRASAASGSGTRRRYCRASA
jgi:hypothetical protein